MTLDKADIQGGVLRPYGFSLGAHLFFKIESAARTREFLRALEVTPATRWPGSKPSSVVNVSFSFAGLALLAEAGAPFDQARLSELKNRYVAFSEGMGARASLLGDEPHSAEDGAATRLQPSDWQDAHVWVSVFSENESDLEARFRRIQQQAKPGLCLLREHVLRARALKCGNARYEHFGFRDDISNPEIEGAWEPGEPLVPLNLGNAKRDASGIFSPIRAGEFLLGHANESGDPLPQDALADFVKNGTFAVFRDLKQNVSQFREYLNAASKQVQRTPEDLGALIVGRQKNGAPLIETPSDDTTLNDFGYDEDREGARCPLASHVRRTHPRDASGVVEVSHRLLRRGMPYGPELAAGAKEDDGHARGLYFIALNACIERQFEFVQRRWVNAATGTGLDDDLDPLVGSRCGKKVRMVIPGSEERPLPRVLEALTEFVQFQGGGYFFMPGIAALRALARGAGTSAKGTLS
jgi:Dyp-type peroxidase family